MALALYKASRFLPLISCLPEFAARTYFMTAAVSPHNEDFMEDQPIQRNCTTCVHRKKDIHGHNVCTRFASVIKGEVEQYPYCDHAFENLCRGFFWFFDY